MKKSREQKEIQISLVLTNDWELYGEGSGDFYNIQKKRLKDLLEIVERHRAKVSLFAEVGQQWAHLKEGQKSPWAMNIAREWEKCVQETVSRGHDVQLHLHPTWQNSYHDGTKWKLNLNSWALADLTPEKIEFELRRGREYLNGLGQSVNPSYRCVTFRAGAFCIQPATKTLSAIKRAGFLSDSSVVPGSWDYLYFDFRNISMQTGPYFANVDDLTPAREDSQSTILELPIHTDQIWESPIIRRLLPGWVSLKWLFGINKDNRFLKWSKARDRSIRDLSPIPDPLFKRRFLARLSPANWLSYVVRKSTYVLDYDFIQPQLFTELIRRAAQKAKAKGIDEIVILALGHANNSHTNENLDQILQSLTKSFSENLKFKTVQQVTEFYLNKKQLEQAPVKKWITHL